MIDAMAARHAVSAAASSGSGDPLPGCAKDAAATVGPGRAGPAGPCLLSRAMIKGCASIAAKNRRSTLIQIKPINRRNGIALFLAADCRALPDPQAVKSRKRALARPAGRAGMIVLSPMRLLPNARGLRIAVAARLSASLTYRCIAGPKPRSGWRPLALCLVGAIALTLGAPSAQALPSYARQTGQECAACHNGFPELTPYGRLFKLNAY